MVSDLKDDTFYAVIWLERNGELISRRFAPQRRSGDRAAPGLSDLCGRNGAENLEDRSLVAEVGNNEELRRMARESQR